MIGELKIKGRDLKTGKGIAVSVREGRITGIKPTVVTDNFWLSPGLIDLQVNGYRGLDLNTDTLDVPTVSALTRELLAAGVTTFAPTLITASREQLLTRLSAIAKALELDPIAKACIPFVHVEGPNISPIEGYRGAHPLEHVRPPSIDEFDQWQKAGNNIIGLVTLSPHFANSTTYIATLVARGVRVSIGHTHATPEQIHEAVNAGASLSTHLGNGIATILARHSNPIWSQLAEDRLYASFISDGHHLPPEVLKAMLRAKSLERSILVSDSVALAGMPPGRYHATIGGEVELSADGRLGMAGTTILAGAALPLLDCIGTAVRMTGLALASVLEMATANPGDFVGGYGRLQLNRRADLLQFQWDETNAKMTVMNVWLAGVSQSLSPKSIPNY